MKTYFGVAFAPLLIASVWAWTFETGRDLSITELGRIHGGVTIEDACCREFGDCQPQYITPCIGYGKWFCPGRIYHQQQSGNDETCTVATEFNPYQCTLSDDDHVCLIEYHCDFDAVLDKCVEDTATYPPQEVATSCTDPGCP